MKTCFRPLWSYDVQKTEQWFTKKAKEGFQLSELHRFKRGFTFKNEEPMDITYRIGYDKIQNVTLSQTMRNDGWEKVTQSGKWYVLANERPLEELHTSTSREGIIKRNNYIMYAFIALLIYFTCILVMNVFIFSTVYFSGGSIEKVDSPYWFITYIGSALATALYLFLIYSVWKIRKTNKALSSETMTPYSGENEQEKKHYTITEEKQMKQDGLLIKRRKFGWMYSPDKLEEWLEQMAAEGNRLYRVNKLGTTFFFLKGKPQKIKYCADYQNLSNDSYFEIHRQSGWTKEFNSGSALQKWTIWSMEYEDDETPLMYSDKSHQMKHAKKIAFSYTVLFLPMVLMYLFIASMNISYGFRRDETWTLIDTNTLIVFLRYYYVWNIYYENLDVLL
ncbi:DUF2812 domain-containing protein [Sutcliffiella rhizosphaerae]|uniref:DUF2812 domain-containing protein n=1 Tax=Sutcliffiella rhizosphaerae TaxID=2880967 RepID=A0ABM8YKB7_9BACI|nr:DUF2812 domain-containing protein [Sutcliffiella rhizosphaerae]CAG9620371.1 hypothetical protein BACCIP111883_01139 [Sutcliffiella rhizosphaerae]